MAIPDRSRPLRKLLCVFLLLPLGARAHDWAPLVRTTFAWHDNITNSDRPADILPAAQTITEFSTAHRLILARLDTLLLVARLPLEAWPRYDGLDRTSPGCIAQWQHKFALGAYAPALRLEATGEAVIARESPRSGLAGTASLSYRQRLNESFLLHLGHERSRHDARALAFDRTGRESSAQLTWQTPTPWFLDLILRRRHGDVLAYSSPPRPDLIAKGKQLTLSDTFERRGSLIAYYFPADTDTLELRSHRPLGRDYSLTLHFATRHTTHGSESYRNRIVSLTLARQF